MYDILVFQIVGLITPLLACAAFSIPLLSIFIRRKVFYDAYLIIVSFIVLLFTSIVLTNILNTGFPIVYAFSGWPPPLSITYEVDLFNAFLAWIVASITFLITIYNVWYGGKIGGYKWFYTLLLGLELGMIGCLYTGDIFNLFVMLEVLAIAAYALVAHFRSIPQALEASLKYAIIGLVATSIYLLSVVFLYSAMGSLNMADIAWKIRTAEALTSLSNGVYGNIEIATIIALSLALWTFIFKGALFPLHFWLPDAHAEAPTSVSALLSGLVVKIGVYAYARFIYTIFGATSIISKTGFRDLILYMLLILGMISSLFGALMMIYQDDIKRLLAYSTISHVGLLFIGLSIGALSTNEKVVELSLIATSYHILNHAVGKALLFLMSGILIWVAGSRKIHKMQGLSKHIKFHVAIMVIGIFHLIGIPPFGGFFSKLILIQACIISGLMLPAVIVMFSSVIAFTGYVRVIYILWLMKPMVKYMRKPPTIPTLVCLVLALACAVSGFVFPVAHNFLSAVAYGSLSERGTEVYIRAMLSMLEYLTSTEVSD